MNTKTILKNTVATVVTRQKTINKEKAGAILSGEFDDLCEFGLIEHAINLVRSYGKCVSAEILEITCDECFIQKPRKMHCINLFAYKQAIKWLDKNYPGIINDELNDGPPLSQNNALDIIDKSTEEIINNKIKIKSFNIIGIYFLMHENEIVYIGQSTNIGARVNSHVKEGHKIFDSYSTINCKKEYLDRVEAHYIAKYIPKYNRSLPANDTSIYKYIGVVENSVKNEKVTIEGVILDKKLYIHKSFTAVGGLKTPSQSINIKRMNKV